MSSLSILYIQESVYGLDNKRSLHIQCRVPHSFHAGNVIPLYDCSCCRVVSSGVACTGSFDAVDCNFEFELTPTSL